MEAFPAGFKDKDGYYYGLRATVNVIAYNTKAVSAAEAPKTWKDLLDPKWKGKMVTAHPGYSGVIATHVLALVNLYGWDYFKQLAQNKLMLVQSAVDPSGVVASGERPVAVTAGDYTFYQIKKKGNPVEIVYPEGGRAARRLAERDHELRARIPTRPGSSPTSSSAGRSSRCSPTPRASTRGHPRGEVPGRQAEALRPQAAAGRSRGAREAQRGDQDSASWSSSGPSRAGGGRGPQRPRPLGCPRGSGCSRAALVGLIAAAAGLARVAEREQRARASPSPTTRASSATRRSRRLSGTRWCSRSGSGCSLAIGAPLAWLTARTDLPGRGAHPHAGHGLVRDPALPGRLRVGHARRPQRGLLNRLYRDWTGAADPLLNIFSMPGLIFVVAIYTFPYVYIMIANTLALIASDLEEAASILGAGRLAVARTVTLPMVLPAMLSGFILAVLQALALFGSPAILASRSASGGRATQAGWRQDGRIMRSRVQRRVRSSRSLWI